MVKRASCGGVAVTLLTSSALLIARRQTGGRFDVISPCEVARPHLLGRLERYRLLPNRLLRPPRRGLDLLASYPVEAQHGEKTLRHPRD